MILHVIEPNRFTTSVINLLDGDERFENHHFLSITGVGVEKTHRISALKGPISRNLFENIKLFWSLSYRAKKIILHGPVLIHFFFIFPFFLKKIFWAINGYELQIIRNNNFYAKMLRFVFKHAYGHLTHIKEDSNLANAILKSKAKFVYSPLYTSNLIETRNFNSTDVSNKQKVNLLVGNSTDPTNNHIEIFDMIERQIHNINKIYCPLSYGVFDDHRDSVIKEGISRFGNKFVALTDLMTSEQYTKFLEIIDIAIFNHDRQQAMGVTLSLLSLGKIVYMRKGTTSFRSLKERGFAIYDNELIQRDGINFKRSIDINKELLERYYSKEVLIQSYLNLH